MSGSQYTTENALKKTLTLMGTTFADYDIIPAITAASDGLNELCNRKFDLDITQETTRYYKAASAEVVVIDDLVELVSFTSDQASVGDFDKEYILDEEIFLWPYNAGADDRPYTQVHLNSYRATVGFPWWSKRGIKIVGKFGWPEQPSFLEVTAKMLASKLIKRMREAPFGVVTVGLDVGSAIRIGRTDPDIMSLIENFQRERPII